jgi:DNA primase
LTTTAVDIDEELLNRCLVLTVDEGREQTEAIHRIQREAETFEGLKSRRDSERVLKLHRNAQRLLEPLPVVNPFAPQLTFLADRTRTRRDHVKYLALIRSITLLHQHQRPVQERDGLRYIEATFADIEAANRLAGEVLARSLDELPPQTRRLLLLIDAMIAERREKHGLERESCYFTRRTVREYTTWGTTQIKLHLDRLQEMEYIGARSGGFGRAFEYELLVDVHERERATGVGLLDIEALKQNYNANLSGSKANLSGQNGNLSGTCRPSKTA